MGQAKQRGTREERIAQAVVRVEAERIEHERRLAEAAQRQRERDAQRAAERKATTLRTERPARAAKSQHGLMLAAMMVSLGAVLVEPPPKARNP